jgi:hypothetical protein
MKPIMLIETHLMTAGIIFVKQLVHRINSTAKTMEVCAGCTGQAASGGLWLGEVIT